MGANKEDLICELISIPVLPSETHLVPTEINHRIITTSVNRHCMRVQRVRDKFQHLQGLFLGLIVKPKYKY